jgi:hypothetical protein
MLEWFEKNPKRWGGIKWCSAVIALLYFTSMFIYPWTQGGWGYVETIWRDWQSLNMGMLAFMAALFGLARNQEIAHNERERDKKEKDDERKQQLRAALANLPQALSDLIEYGREALQFLEKVWPYIDTPEGKMRKVIDEHYKELTPPELMESHVQVFKDCMEFGGSNLYRILSKILRHLQINNTRIRKLIAEISPGSTKTVTTINILSLFYRVTEAQVMIDRLFGYARERENLNISGLVYDEFRTALILAEVEVDEFPELVGFIRSVLERENADPSEGDV